MLQLDVYKTLGVDRSADPDGIRKAYRKMALKFHPDKNNAPEAYENFKKIAEAYDILSNSKRRAIYDQYGPDGLTNGVPPRDDFEGYSGGYAFHGNPEEVFAQFFGGKNPFADFFAVHTEPPTSYPSQFGNKFGGMHGMNYSNPAIAPPVQDASVEKKIPLTLEELYKGTVKKVKISRKVLGEDGITTSESQKVLTIEIKKGWRHGTRITFPGEGDQGPNKIPADVVFIVEEKKHDRFVRDGHNLVFTTEMTLGNALAGTTVEVKTLDDRVLTIPINEVVHPDYVKVIPKEGMPISKSNERGDLLLKFNIKFPTYFSHVQKQQIKKLIP